MAALTTQPPGLQSRVDLLEKQVAGLMGTVSLLYEKMRLDKWNIPKPDLAVQAAQGSLGERKDNVRLAPAEVGSKPVPQLDPSKAAKAEPPVVPPLKDLTRLEPYGYSPLNAGVSEIRIISILVSKAAHEPVECELSAVRLPDSLRHPDAPRFMALSYTWGGLEKTDTILVNGKSFLVTKNLHKALKHFRNADPNNLISPGYPVSSSRSRFSKSLPNNWWIDAICINQDDLDERKTQVALMTRLYRMARASHVWLGEEANDSSRAMDLIRKLSHKPSDEDQREVVERQPGQTHRLQGPGTVPEQIPAEPAPLPEDEKNRNYQAIIQLFKRDWFSRAWILQEMALPRKVTVHCGDQVCSWDQLRRTVSLLVYVADEYKLPSLQRPQLTERGSLISAFQRTEQLSRLRDVTQSRLLSRDPYLSLITALCYAKNSSATDLRDKVFAILPLVSPDATRLAADYRQPHVEVYKATALDLAATHLDFLSACQYTEGATSELPSWVPDFSQPWKYYPMLVTIKSDTEVERAEEPVSVYLPAQSALKVGGYILDTISRVCDSFVTTESSGIDVQAVKSEWQRFTAENDIDGLGRYELLDNLRHYSSGSATYWPLYKPGYVGGRGDSLDLSIRALKRHLVTSFADSDLDESKKLGWYRNFFVGRRFVQTKDRHCGFVPAAAMPGDKVCKFRGSGIIYIVRESSPRRWLMIGDSYFLGNYTDYEISHMRPALEMQDMYLV